jgi:hypothetical protein
LLVVTDAAAAAELGLSWLVFLDEYHLLSNSSYAALKADCKNFSTPTLQLWPGYTSMCTRNLLMLVVV